MSESTSRNRPTVNSPAVAAGPPPAESSPGTTTLSVDVVWGDLTHIEGNVFAVGHYMGVLPQNAELSLDRELSGKPDAKEGDSELFITDLTRRGAIRGALGETVLFPWADRGHVALAGMGRLGAFHEAELRALARSLVSTTCRLINDATLCSVMIGSGVGNLPTPQAADAFLRGVVDALAAGTAHRLLRLRLVERELDKSYDLFDAVSAVAKELGDKGPIAISPKHVRSADGGGVVSRRFACSLGLGALAHAMKASPPGVTPLDTLLGPLSAPARAALQEELLERSKDDASVERIALELRLAAPRVKLSTVLAARVSFQYDNLQLRQAAITNRATTTERARLLPLDWLDRIVERLQAPPLDTVDQDAARAWRRLVHADLKEPLTGDSSPLVLEVDANTARVPWEVLRDGSTERLIDAPDYLALRRPLARQLRTTYSPRASDVGQHERLKALVIGDPDDSLPSAVNEAKEIAKLLTDFGVDAVLRLGPSDGNNRSKYKGIDPAGLYEVLGDLLDGEFDLVHFCGHAHFDERFPARSGWAFANGAVLTPSMLEGIDNPPRLVVANACQSSVLSVPRTEESTNQQAPERGDTNAASRIQTFNGYFLPGLADEFFRRGVSDFIGTAWEVRDSAAAIFATTFYNELLNPEDPMPLGEAVKSARTALYLKRSDWVRDGALWAAYQHYGDPTRRIGVRLKPK